MTIAFDVKGTLDGPSSEKVFKLYRALEHLGHELIVWSSVYRYATDAVIKYDLQAKAEQKSDKWNTSPQNFYDVAIDDEPQTWLAAHRIILVKDLPDDIEAFALSIAPTTGGANGSNDLSK